MNETQLTCQLQMLNHKDVMLACLTFHFLKPSDRFPLCYKYCRACFVPVSFCQRGFSGGDTSPTRHVTEVSVFCSSMDSITFSQFPQLSLHAVATFHASDAAKLVFSQIDEKREGEKKNER